MTRIGFDDQACQKFRARLDSYIDNELLTESNLEMIEHFRCCTSCTREAQDCHNLRRRLRDAVRDVPVSTGLEHRVRDRLRQPKQPQPKKLFLMAIAAALVVCFGDLRLTDSTGRLLRVALDDHLHCAVIHHPVPPGEPNQLPDRIKGLTGLVQQRVPPRFALLLAHECREQDHNFVHLTFSDGRHLLSVLITRRVRSESLGQRTRQASRDHFQLAAFESGEFFFSTVSDLPARVNADILAAFAPGLLTFLDHA
jgi:anti-sigma factor RsiW